MDQCHAFSFGYICHRLADHGSLHWSRESGWWIHEADPRMYEEVFGRREATGYRLIQDTMLGSEPLLPEADA